MLTTTLRPPRAVAPLRLSAYVSSVLPATIRALTTESAAVPEIVHATPSSTTAALPEEAAKVDLGITVTEQPRAPPQLPYFVGRTKSDSFAIYHRADRGGNLKRTLLKKAEGDKQALMMDLANSLSLTKKDLSVNTTTGHIVVRGHKKDEIFQYLHKAGF